MENEQHAKLLENIASFELSPGALQHLESNLSTLKDWDGFIKQIELNGLAPLFNKHLNDHSSLSDHLPKVVYMQFKALVVRHRLATEVREKAITEVLQAFDVAKLQAIALKGLALAYCIYPSPSLRPMRDIDLLVAKQRAAQAQQTLRDIGYKAEDRKTGSLYDHHHLPEASKTIDGMHMSLEVHHDALSGDVASSIAAHNLTEELIEFEINHQRVWRLGHIDTLRHLCHHTFEPAQRIKLGSILDLVHYAHTYCDEIDWPRIRKQYPFIINSLRCVHFITPLPSNLMPQINPPTCKPPSGLGKGFLPLSQLMQQKGSFTDKLRTMLTPSAWWAHIFYDVPPEKSLFWVRWIRHPAQLAKWLWRRYFAIFKEKLNS